jgi:hypothetical protein
MLPKTEKKHGIQSTTMTKFLYNTRLFKKPLGKYPN